MCEKNFLKILTQFFVQCRFITSRLFRLKNLYCLTALFRLYVDCNFAIESLINCAILSPCEVLVQSVEGKGICFENDFIAYFNKIEYYMLNYLKITKLKCPILYKICTINTRKSFSFWYSGNFSSARLYHIRQTRTITYLIKIIEINNFSFVAT